MSKEQARKTGHRRERGQVLLISVLVLPILLGFTALAIDLGAYSADRRTMQNAADSMALAAAQSLPDASAATANASAWAQKNGIAAGQYTLTIAGGSTDPTARVVITKSHSF